MSKAKSFAEILPGVFRWEAYSPAHKVDLTAHAIRIERRLYIFDPIPLERFAFQQLVRHGVPVAIILTNDNHERDSEQWRKQLRVPICAAFDANVNVAQVERFGPDLREWIDWKVTRVSGGTQGELAFFRPDQSLMVLGDAVTNLPGYDLMLLTEAYCEDQPTLRHSLRQLLFTHRFEKLLMAHGRPLLTGAAGKMNALL